MYTYTLQRLNHMSQFDSDNIAERWLKSINSYYTINGIDINTQFIKLINNNDNKNAFDIFTKITEFDDNNGTYWKPTLREAYDSYNMYGRQYIFSFIIPYAKDIILL